MQLHIYLYAWLLKNVIANNSYRLQELGRKLKNKLPSVTAACDTNIELLTYLISIQKGDITVAAWKLKYYLYILEGTTQLEQKHILCILQLSYSTTLQLVPCNPAQENMN